MSAWPLPQCCQVARTDEALKLRCWDVDQKSYLNNHWNMSMSAATSDSGVGTDHQGSPMMTSVADTTLPSAPKSMANLVMPNGAPTTL